MDSKDPIDSQLVKPLISLFENEDLFEYREYDHMRYVYEFKDKEFQKKIVIPVIKEFLRSGEICSFFYYEISLKRNNLGELADLRLFEIFIDNIKTEEFTYYFKSSLELFGDIFLKLMEKYSELRLSSYRTSSFWFDFNGIYKKIGENLSPFIKKRILNAINQNKYKELHFLLEEGLFHALDRQDAVSIFNNSEFDFVEYILNLSKSYKFDPDEEVSTIFWYFTLKLDKYISRYIKKSLIRIINKVNSNDIESIIRLSLHEYIDNEVFNSLGKEGGMVFVKIFYDFYSYLDSNTIDNYFNSETRKAGISKTVTSLFLKALRGKNIKEMEDSSLLYIRKYIIDEDLKLVKDKVWEMIKEIIQRGDEQETKSLFLMGLFDYLNENHISLLMEEQKFVELIIIYDRYWHDSYESKSFHEFCRKNKQLINSQIKKVIINKLESGKCEEIFRLWDLGYLSKLEKEDLIQLFNEHGDNLIESILKSLHFIAYEQKKHKFDSEIDIVPVEYEKTIIEYEYKRIDIIPRDLIKEIIIEIIKKQDFTSLVPLLAAYFLHYLEPIDIQKLINDEESGFFKNIIRILGNYHDELYYYNDDFYIGHLEFFKMCKLIDKNHLKSLLLSVIIDDSFVNYGSIFEEGLIRKFNPSELIEILEHLDREKFKAFLISLTEAVRYFEEFDDYESKKSYRYIVDLEDYLSKSLKESIVNIIKESEPESVYISNCKLIKKTWYLPLNLGKLGWFRHLKLRQLKVLLTTIKEKYRDKDIENWEKTEFRIVINNIRKTIRDFHEKPIERISLSKAQLREFLNRLAGDEGCQFNGIEWRCGGKEFVYARRVLDKMKITQKDQELLLEKCKEYDGYCDCEILMNAAQMLLNEEASW